MFIGQRNWGSGIDFCEWISLGATVDVPRITVGPQPCLVTIRVSEGNVIATGMPSAFAMGFNAICVGATHPLQQELHRRSRQRQRVLFGYQEWKSQVAQRNPGTVATMVDQIEAM